MKKKSPKNENPQLAGSVTRNIVQLNASQDRLRQDAAQRIWDYFIEDMANYVSRRLNEKIRRREDEDDILQEAFDSFFRRQKNGEFRLGNRGELRALLITIITAKVCNAAQFHGAQKRDFRRESRPTAGDSLTGLEQLCVDRAPENNPANLSDDLHSMLDMLPEDLRQIAIWRLDGQTYEAIGKRLGVTKGAIIKRVKKIRDAWSTL